MNKYRLFSHFVAINLVGTCFLLLAFLNGWCAKVIAADSSYVSYVIFGLFLFALFSAGCRVLSISNEMDQLENASTEPDSKPAGPNPYYRAAAHPGSNASRALEIRLFSRISHIRTIGNGLVVLGLIGTVVGFILVSSEVDAESAADVGQVGALVGALLHGMGVAFYTTLVGAIFSLWLSLNYQILYTGTANLLAALLERSDSTSPQAA